MSERKYRIPASKVKFIKDKLIPFILREQGNGFIMEDWVQEYSKDYVQQNDGELYFFDGIAHKPPKCDTVACIGGSIEVLKLGKMNTVQDELACAEAIGLTLSQAKGLFYHWTSDYREASYKWPKEYMDKFTNAETPLAKAKVAVSLLREVIRTNGECLGPRKT